MIKYAIITNEQTKQCSVGLGSDTEYYASIGMTEMDVEQSWNGLWYVAGHAPTEPLEHAKAAKRSENSAACATARATQAFTVTLDGTELAFLTDTQTASDLQNAYLSVSLGQTVPWVDEHGTAFTFTAVSQVASVLAVLNPLVSALYQTWSGYEAQITAATTASEVNAIVIDYGINTVSDL